MPFLKNKFATYASFARASLAEIYTLEKLDTARQLKATTLATSLLRNDGTGRFTAEPLPPEAQFAPGSGIVLEDFDGDGDGDIALAQNFYVAQRETGRLNAALGLILTNDGHGHFAPLPCARSGIQWRADARALVALDMNGDGVKDLLLTVNNAAPRTALNRRPARR